MRLFLLLILVFFYAGASRASNLDCVENLVYETSDTEKSTFFTQKTFVYSSELKVVNYHNLFKKSFPHILPLQFSDTIDSSGYIIPTFVDLGGISGNKGESIVFFQDKLNGISVLFSHPKAKLSGLASIIPRCTLNYTISVNDFNTGLVMDKNPNPEIKIEFKNPKTQINIDFKNLDIMLSFCQQQLGGDVSDLKISVVSPFISGSVFEVCQHIETYDQKQFQVSYAYLAPIVVEYVDQHTKFFYDPTKVKHESLKFSPSLNRIAISSKKGDITQNFSPSLLFATNQDPEKITIPANIPVEGKIDHPTKTDASFNFFYDKQIVQNYKERIKNVFPNAVSPTFMKGLTVTENSLLNEVGVNCLSWSVGGDCDNIYHTEGVWDCAVLVMSNPKYNLQVMNHLFWPANVFNCTFVSTTKTSTDSFTKKRLSDYAHLDEMLGKLSKHLPEDYKEATQVHLLSYYLSDNLIEVGKYLTNKGFKISTLSYNDIVMENNGNIYLDQNSVYHSELKNYNRFTGQRLLPRKVALDRKGNLCVGWEKTITFKK
jgi:hypothetical protein